jgi:hypothetical protein
MERIQEKVKDLIDVRPYNAIQDFLSDPAQTLSSYHFTDITSNMMAQWLDKILNINIGNGAACALAGYRGVGKSHFLATIGAVVGHPELRSRISQPHVASSAQRLKRRRYPVAFVRRGTQVNLIDEIKDGITELFNIDVADLTDSLSELLSFAEAKADDLPLILLIDTALERGERVSRDDGRLLSEIAEIAKRSNIFVAVALDDDITGADGVNSSIVKSFTIDYLDQEHLYRIVDNHIFPKHRQALPIIKEIYTNLKKVLPHFRWSEPRFTSLYPLHPVILEIAPAIRLYAPEFALLSFASEAGSKIMGRPANSLIALDEVFDSVEDSLRKIPNLKEAFETYDKLNTEVVAHIPVMERLQAKLVLKGLMLLSLEGEGTTEGAIRAAMLIYNENQPEKAKATVEELLNTFVSVFPENIQQTEEEGRENLYSLKVDSKENLHNALTEAINDVSGDVIPKILRRMARERFYDWYLPEEEEQGQTDSINASVVWRGSLRNGLVTWDLENIKPGELKGSTDAGSLDWEVIINPYEIDDLFVNRNDQNETPRVFWQPAPLKKSEAETILRYFVLLTNPELHEEYGEQVQAAGYAHTISVERIWNRIFLQDSKFVIDGIAHGFTEEARAAQGLSEMLAIMLEPLFNSRFPNHPHFSENLKMDAVSVLVNDFFSGAKQNVPEVQQLAEFFALPLELVYLEEDVCLLETEENITNLSLSKEVLALVDKNKPDETVSLDKVYRQLKKSPYGLTREAQHLLLTALVAQRQIEFVTSKGDRISRRSLDLKIIWEDIEGVAAPAVLIYSSSRLVFWAKLLTNSEDFESIKSPEDTRKIKEAFGQWLLDWEEARVLERFNELPDEILNTKIWGLASRAEKSFGITAGIIKEIVNNTLAVEDGLQRIADVYSDSEDEFYNRTRDLVILEDFIKGALARKEIWSYLAVCETTEDEKIEYFREKLLTIIEQTYFEPQDNLNREMQNYWESFHTRFSEHFAGKHDIVMKSHLIREMFEDIIRSDQWWEFENLARLPIFPQIHYKRVQKICRQFKELDCSFEVKDMLKTHPFCICNFSLAKIRDWEKLPERLIESIEQARSSYRNILILLRQLLIPLVEQFWSNNQDEEFGKAANHLIELLTDEEKIPLLTTEELIILQKVLEELPEASLLDVHLPADLEYSKREDFRTQINEWLDDLPDKSVLLKA